MKREIAIVLMSFGMTAMSLYCTDIRAVGTGSRFSVQVLGTIPDEDLISCLVFLGKDPLSHEQGQFIWERLIKMYEGVASIPEKDLQHLGWIAKSIPIKDIANLTIDDIDTIAAFGQYHNLTFQQLQALAEQVREDWSAKEPTDYTFYDLMALKHILCGFNRTEIESIHPDSYKEAANVLATLKGCPKEPLEALAGLAMSEDAFGDPSTWHSSQVKSVGCVLNGFEREEIQKIPPEGIESVTPDIIPCLEKASLKALTSAQLKHLTPSAAAAMSSEQKSMLSSDQRKAVDEAYAGTTNAMHSVGHTNSLSMALMPFAVALSSCNGLTTF